MTHLQKNKIKYLTGRGGEVMPTSVVVKMPDNSQAVVCEYSSVNWTAAKKTAPEPQKTYYSVYEDDGYSEHLDSIDIDELHLNDNPDSPTFNHGHVYRGTGTHTPMQKLVPVENIIEMIQEAPENLDLWVPEYFLDEALKDEAAREDLAEVIASWMNRHHRTPIYQIDDIESVEVKLLASNNLEEVE